MDHPSDNLWGYKGYQGFKVMRTLIDTLWDQTKILEYLPKKAKIQIFDRNSNPTFISETGTKSISNRPWPNDYNWITKRRYKVWTPQGRIVDKFTVLEETKEEQSLTFFWFLFNNSIILQWVHAIYKTWLKIENLKNVLNNKTLNKSWFGLKFANPK